MYNNLPNFINNIYFFNYAGMSSIIVYFLRLAYKKGVGRLL